MIELFILANGNSKIGMGHINRSLTLQSALSAHGVKVTYISYDNDQLALDRLNSVAGLDICNVDKDGYTNPKLYLNLILEKSQNPSLLYIDSDDTSLYSKGFQKGIISSGIFLMYATLYDQFYYYAHIVFNQNIMASEQNFQGEEYTKMLLGPQYFFWPEKSRRLPEKNGPIPSSPYKLFVNFGNADPNDVVQKVLTVLRGKLEYFSEIIIVLGGLYANPDNIKQIASFSNKVSVYINPADIYDLMYHCDIGLSSLGMTHWELTQMNIPTMVIPAAKREVNVSNYMHRKKYSYKLGEYNDTDWLKKWTNELDQVISKKRIYHLKTQELHDQINVNGVDEVVNEILSLPNQIV